MNLYLSLLKYMGKSNLLFGIIFLDFTLNYMLWLGMNWRFLETVKQVEFVVLNAEKSHFYYIADIYRMLKMSLSTRYLRTEGPYLQ